MSQIIDLNGEWKFIADPSNEGLDSRWYATIPSEVKPVNVPHIWEVDFGKPEGSIGFYYKELEIDANENPKRMYLRFKRIAIHAMIWINGKKVAENFGAYHPIEIDISKSVKPGEKNFIAVRVSTMDSYGRVNGRNAADMPIGRPWQNQRFSGIYGDVEFVLGQRAFIRYMNIIPDQDMERVTLEMKFSNPRNFQAKMHILITDPNGDLGMIKKDARLDREDATLHVSLSFKEMMLWSTQTPNLYTVEVHLDKSIPVEKKFGFRKFDCLRGNHFYLNDKIIKIRGILYNQESPKEKLISMNPKKVREEIQQLKDYGFNAVRTGGAPFPSEILDICDELGMLVFQDLPMYTQKSSKEGLEHAKEAIENTIIESNYHACVVSWVLGAENSTLMLENGTKLLKVVDQFDSTRPGFSNLNSVTLDHERLTKRDSGKLLGVTTKDKIILNDSHRLHPKANVDANFTRFLTTYCTKGLEEPEVPDLYFGDASFQEDYEAGAIKQKGMMLVTLRNHDLISDFKRPDKSLNEKAQGVNKDLRETFNKSDFSSLWKDIPEFIAEANETSVKSKQDHVDAVFTNPQVNAVFFDQWADAAGEFSGILTENRKSKGIEESVPRLAGGTRVLISSLDRSANPGEEIDFHLSFLNEERHPSLKLEALIKDAGNKKGASVLSSFDDTDNAIVDLGDFSLKAPSKEGKATLIVTVKGADDKVINTVEEEMIILKESKIKAEPCYLDEAEDSTQMKEMMDGPENTIICSTPSSWNPKHIVTLMEKVKEGKNLILTELDFDDIEFLNECKVFDFEVEDKFLTGSNGAAWHFILKKDHFNFYDKKILDNRCAFLVPNVSMGVIEGADVHVGAWAIEDGEVREGADLQTIDYGKGKVVFCQLPLLESLENSAVSKEVFNSIVNSLK